LVKFENDKRQEIQNDIVKPGDDMDNIKRLRQWEKFLELPSELPDKLISRFDTED
jgi:hypothetical protein